MLVTPSAPGVDPGRISRRALLTSASEMAASSVSLGELRYGASGTEGPLVAQWAVVVGYPQRSSTV